MSFAERFLRQPGLVPPAGERMAWGPHELRIELVGGPYSLQGLNSAQVRETMDVFTHFAAAEPATAAGVPVVEVKRVDPALFVEFSRAGWVYSFDVDYRETRIHVAGRGFFGVLERDPELAGTLWLAGDAYDDGLAISNFLRVLVADRVLGLGGLMVHSSGVIVDGAGWLFFGPSGVGKSTLAKKALAEGERILGDDINVILRHGRGFRVEDFPLAGELRRDDREARSAPLAGLCRLRQSPALETRRLSTAQMYASLFSCTPFVNDDSEAAERVHDNLIEVLSSVTAAELALPRQARFSEIRGALGEL